MNEVVTKMTETGGLGEMTTVRGGLVIGTVGAIEVLGNLVGAIVEVKGGEVGGMEEVEEVGTTSPIIGGEREMSSKNFPQLPKPQSLANRSFFYRDSQVPKIGTSAPDASAKPAPTSTSQPPAETPRETTATETSAAVPPELTLPDAPNENTTSAAPPKSSKKRAREIDDDGGEDTSGDVKKSTSKAIASNHEV